MSTTTLIKSFRVERTEEHIEEVTKISKRIVVLFAIILIVAILSQALALQTLSVTIHNIGTIDTSTPSSMALTAVGHEFYNGDGVKVFLRGVGVAYQNNDARGWWSGPGESYYTGRWETNLTLLAERIDANLAALKSWGGNVIRVFPAVNWWWIDNINPYERYGEGPDQDMSYRDYFELLVQRAELQGVYVIFCPYELVSYQEDYVGFGGLPVQGGPDSRGKAVLDAIYSGDPTYTEPMRRWWQSVAGRLGKYSNVIFEIWNEPDEVNKANWFNHQIEMYKTIRQSTSNVVLFMWRMGAVPGWQEELSWIPDFHNQLRTNLASEPVNVGYDFHAYRYVWNLQWGTDYSSVYGQLTSANWIPQTRSGGVDVPVLCGETGIGLDVSNLSAETGWWNGLLRSFNELDVGYLAYYWIPADLGWEPEQGMFVADSANYWPEGQLAPTPSVAGDIFLDNMP